MKYKILNINCDGGARGNPGPAAIGAICHENISSKVPEEDPRTVRFSQNQKSLFTLSQYIGETTNNVAEYTAVIKVLEHLRQKDITADQITFVLDSELIVRQITGVYKIKQPHLQQLAATIHTLLPQLESKITFTHVKRALNKQADALVNQALDKQLH